MADPDTNRPRWRVTIVSLLLGLAMTDTAIADTPTPPRPSSAPT